MGNVSMTIKASALAFFAAVITGIIPANAADQNGPVLATKAPVYVSGDAFSGFYAGAHGGYGWQLGDAFDNFGPISIAALTAAPQGFVGGLHAGVGQRFASIWYAGLEGDVDIATLSGSSTTPGLVSSTSKNTFMGSVRARFGVIPVGHALIYGTAGYGFGTGEFTVNDLVANASATVKPTMSGLVWGVGAEVPIANNWLARVQYLQYDFGTATVMAPTVTYTVKDRVDTVTAGVSYRF